MFFVNRVNLVVLPESNRYWSVAVPLKLRIFQLPICSRFLSCENYILLCLSQHQEYTWSSIHSVGNNYNRLESFRNHLHDVVDVHGVDASVELILAYLLYSHVLVYYSKVLLVGYVVCVGLQGCESLLYPLPHGVTEVLKFDVN